MNNVVAQHIRQVIAETPVNARLINHEGFRHPDFGPAMVGVLLEFDSGDLYQIGVPADRNDNPSEIGARIAAAIIFLQALRNAVAGGDAKKFEADSQ